MVILVEGQCVKDEDIRSLDTFYQKFPNILSGAKKLAAMKKKIVKPEGVLYARQKEWVLSHKGDRFNDGQRVLSCGTEDVLTCHVVVLHHPLTGVVGLGHFDEYCREKGLERFLNAFLDRIRERYFATGEDDEDEDEFEWEEWEEDEINDDHDDDADYVAISDPIYLSLVGGYKDEAGKAHKLSMKILNFFHRRRQPSGRKWAKAEEDISHQFRLTTCCLGEPNSAVGRYVGKNEPIIGGVNVKVDTGEIIPASFNRTFVSAELDEETVMTLLLGPSLIRKPAKLKKIILQKEDQGYQRSVA